MKRGKEYIQSLKGKKVLIVGLGKSGKAAAKALNEAGAKVSVQDSKTSDKLDTQFIQYMQNEGITAYLGSVPEDMTSFDMLVLSPGVPPQLGFIQEAEQKGAEIIGELELAYRMTDAHFAAITGTNGKTTTTTLAGEIFKAAGRKTSVVGNIGNPVVTEAVNADRDAWMVTEVSSFQLETTKDFRPEVSAILNLTPDHLNRHKTMKAYGDAKARVAVNQSPDQYLIINHDDSAVIELAKQSKATIVPFSRKEALSAGAYLDGEEIVIRDFDGSLHDICSRNDLRIIGDHNV